MIKLGYEIPTGDLVEIPLKHLAVTGQTQESGKTTTLEALIQRSGLRAIAFRTKRGESAFASARTIPPYFRERADWQFVESILEATMRQRMRFERAWVMRATKGASTLAEVRANVRKLQAKSTRGMDADIYMLLGEYLDLVVPLIEQLPAAESVELAAGVNVMDLGAYPHELQALVIRSVLEWIYERERDTVTVLPEAWEFVPQARGSPVKLAAAQLIRKGAALHNYVWLDSQDLAGVDKEILKQVSVWLIGVQRETNELKRALAHIPAGVKRPKLEDLAQLGRGQFWACWHDRAVRVYVQPAWLADDHAIAISRGELRLEDLPAPPQHEEPMPQEPKRMSRNNGTTPPPMPRPAYVSHSGRAYLGDARQLLPSIPSGSVSLCCTSPPFPLRREKAYGNVTAEEYIDWFMPIAEEIQRVLRPEGSFVMELGGGWNPDGTRSLMKFDLVRRLGSLFYLADEHPWTNPRALPAPAEWVCKQRVRCKDAVTMLYWFSKTIHPYADNRAVVTPYARPIGTFRNGTHPSGHKLAADTWQRDNGGAIPPNFFAVPGVGCDDYVRRCRAGDLVVHPARQPPDIPEHFIRMLTKPNQLVLDPFAGSNTTGRVAQDLGRRWVSIEIQEQYLQASKLRFSSNAVRLPRGPRVP